MKRLFTILMMSMLIGLPSAFAEEPTFTEFPDEIFFNNTGGTQVTALSRNGRWASGGTYVRGGFVYDVEKDSIWLGGGGKISDLGDMVLGSYVYNIETRKTTRLERIGDFFFSMTTDISADGRIVTGMVGPDWTNLMPCYWEDGKFSLLPFPSTANVGRFKVNGCQARWVNGDGSVIVGYFVANPNTNLMIVWERQPDGTYQYIDTWTEFYEPQHGLVYDYDRKEYDFVKGPNPWMRMEPAAVTYDGKTVALYLQNNYSDEMGPPYQLGFYHVDTGTIEAFPYNPNDQMGDAREFIVCGFSDYLTVCGITGALGRDPKPFIKYYNEAPQYLNNVFPEFNRLWDYDDLMAQGMPYLCTGMSRDENVIVGYATCVAEYWNDEGQTTQDLGFWGFSIKTGDRKSPLALAAAGKGDDNGDDNDDDDDDVIGSSVETIGAEDLAPAEYFTLDGRKVLNPDKGIFIEKKGEKTRKIVK